MSSKKDNPIDQEYIDKKVSWKIFDKISEKYDLLNKVLSLGIDRQWRKVMISHFPKEKLLHCLDIATGTGDICFMFYRKCKHRMVSITGIDLSEKMLKEAEKKRKKKYPRAPIRFQKGDACDLKGINNNEYDVVSIAFGIRNVPDVDKALSEMYRVLRKKGRLLILEFSLPQNRILKAVYLFYFRNILPKVGGWISGDKKAYRYLNESVEAFPYADVFCDQIKKAGFESVSYVTLSGGIASLYIGEKA